MRAEILTFLLTAIGVGGAVVDPYISFLVYVCFAIIRPEALWPWITPGRYSLIVALAMIIGWLARGGGSWKFRSATPVVIGLLGYWGWAVISGLHASHRDVATDYVVTLSKIVLPAIIGLTLVDSTKKLKQLIWVVVVSYGYISYEMNMSYFSGYNRAEIDGFGGGRSAFGIGLVAVFGPAVYLGLAAEKPWQKAIAFVSALLILHTTFLTYSRGALVALIITGGVAILITPKRPKEVAALLVVAFLGVTLTGSRLQERFLTVFAGEQKRDASAESRVELWQDCIALMRAHPILGVGPGHFPVISWELGWDPGQSGLGKEAHTLWLQVGAELGVPGLFSILLFYAACLWGVWPLCRRKSVVPDPWFRDAARMVVSSIVGFAIAAQFVSMEFLEVPYYIAILGAGLLKLRGTLPVAEAAPEAPPQRILPPQPVSAGYARMAAR
jgi:O-antigen ligase